MTSLGDHLDRLDTLTAEVVREQPPPAQAGQILGAWPPVADAAARALLRIPTLNSDDTAGLFRSLIDLAHQPTPVGGGLAPMASIADAYLGVRDRLDDQPVARGADVHHAQILHSRLTRPLNTLAEWTSFYAAPHQPRLQAAFDDLARSTPSRQLDTGTRYADLGAVDLHADDPILRVAARWATHVTASLQPERVSTSGLRATLGDLNITTASAYYLTKAVLLTRHVDPGIGTDAVAALWDARNEWRIQARQFPRDLRLGDLISAERNRAAVTLRDTLSHHFHDGRGDWLPAGELTTRHTSDKLLLYARALTDVSQRVGSRYLDALRRLPNLPVMRHDPTYSPVFPVGTDLAKVRRDRWLPVAINDPELRQLASRASLAASETRRALDAVRDTALDTGPGSQTSTIGRPSPTYSKEALVKVIAALDAMIPAAHTNRPINPGSRPAWAGGTTPPESLPDSRAHLAERPESSFSRNRTALGKGRAREPGLA